MQQTILLLQENEPKAAVIQELLHRSKRKRFAIEWLRSCDTALERLTNGTQEDVAAILVDLGSAEGLPLEVFDRIHAAAPHAPILVLSDPEHEAVAEQAVRRGAQDYILDTQLDGYSLLKAVHNMIERAAIAEASFVERERAQVTLNSIGDAVISTDVAGYVTYLNRVAETMTGWSAAEALGRSFSDVFQVTNGAGAEHTTNPIALAMQENKTVGLAVGAMLIRRDGHQTAIEDSAAPIHDRRGQVTGAVMVFHDVTQAREMSQRMSYLAHHDYLTGLRKQWPRLAGNVSKWRSYSSMWIVSNTSTTPWAMRSVTNCCCRSRAAWSPAYAARIPSAVRAAMNS